MALGIDHFKDFLEVLSFIATIIGGIAILLAARDYSISRKQLHLSALQGCISRFRDDFLDLSPDSSPEKVIDYLDLINEELFYFEHQYLPLEVAEEWIDGMIQMIPLFGPDGQPLAGDQYLPQIQANSMLDWYRFKRIKLTFTLPFSPSMDRVFGNNLADIDTNTREKIVHAIIKNLRAARV